MSFETTRAAYRAALLSIPMFAIAFTGCADSDASEKPPTPKEKAEEVKKEIEESPAIKATYYPNGTRLVEFVNQPDSTLFQSILQVCDGFDLLEQTDSAFENGVAGSSRSTNHPACEDGRLTAADFEQELQLQDN